MSSPAVARSGWTMLAGLVLVIDGLVALLLSGALFMLSLFPPVAAIEGRPPVDQSMFGPAFGVFAFAIASFWVGQRSIRGNPNGRILGVVVAGLVVALLASIPVTNPTLDPPEVALLVAFAAVQMIVVVALLRLQVRGAAGDEPNQAQI